MYFLIVYGAGALTTALILGIGNQFAKRKSRRGTSQYELQSKFRRMLQENSDKLSTDEKSVYALSQKFHKSALAIESSPHRKLEEVTEKEIVELEDAFKEALKYGELSHKEYLLNLIAKCENKYAQLRNHYDPEYYNGIPEQMHRVTNIDIANANRETEVFVGNTLTKIEILLDPMNAIFKATKYFRQWLKENDDIFSDAHIEDVEKELARVEAQTTWGRNPVEDVEKQLGKIRRKNIPRFLLNQVTGFRF